MTLAPAETATARPSARPPADPPAPGLGNIARTALGFVIVVVAWELLARTVLDGTNLIAPPSGIVASIVDNWDLYQRALRTTLWEAARGFVWGNLAALLLAALVAVVPATERIVLRVALVVFCLPLVAMGPLLRVVYGIGDGPQVTLAALAVFYTTLVPLLVGLRAVPQSWSDLVASYGRGRLTTLRTVRARASIPYLFAGLQVAAPAAFLGALVGEFTGAERGVGILIINSMRALRTDELWAVATISAAVSMARLRPRRLDRPTPGHRPGGPADGATTVGPSQLHGSPVRAGRRRGGHHAGHRVRDVDRPDGPVRPRPLLRQAPDRCLELPVHRPERGRQPSRDHRCAGLDGSDRRPRLRARAVPRGGRARRCSICRARSAGR